MRVLVLTHLFPSAVEPMLGIFIRKRTLALAQLCEVTVLAPVTRAGLPDRERVGGLEVLRPRWRRLPKIGILFDGRACASAAGRALRQYPPARPFDVIDAHWLYPDAFAAVRLGQRLGKPVAVTGRGSDVDEFLFRWPVRRFARAALRGAAQIVALTRRHKERMIEAGAEAERIAVIPNGVDTGLFCPGDRAEARRALGLPAEGVVLLSAGSIVRDKGHQHLIAGLARCIADCQLPIADFGTSNSIGNRKLEIGNQLRLYIAGPGDYRGALERLARERGVAERVTFLGRVAQSRMPLWYRAADLFCFGSYHEGCPNAVLEALACGTPVVSTDVGGIPDLVDEGRSGILFAPRSDEAFAAALRTALAKPWDRAEIAEIGSRRSWAHVAAEYHRAFGEMLARR